MNAQIIDEPWQKLIKNQLIITIIIKIYKNNQNKKKNKKQQR